MRVLAGHAGPVTCGQFAPDGTSDQYVVGGLFAVFDVFAITDVQMAIS